MKKLLRLGLILACIGVISVWLYRAYPSLPTYPNVKRYISTKQYVEVPKDYPLDVDVQDYRQAFITNDSVQTIEAFYLREMEAYGWELKSREWLRFEAPYNAKNIVIIYIDDNGTSRTVQIGYRAMIAIDLDP